MPLIFLLWRCSLALFACLALLISFASNVMDFLEKKEEENIAKYFIYLTNYGRLLAALALGLEASNVSVCSTMLGFLAIRYFRLSALLLYISLRSGLEI